MSVRVQCPHCSTTCQIQDQFLGSNVTCGKCAKVFATRRPESAPATSSAETATAPPTSPAASVPSAPAATEQGAGKSAPQRALTSWWSGVQNLYQKTSKAISSVIPKKTGGDGDPRPTTAGEGDEEIGLDLDGPTAEAMKNEEETEKQRPPKLGTEPVTLHGKFRLDIGGATSMGRVRDRNEDSFLVQQQSWSNLDARHELALVVVADGMGGYQAGDRASHITIQQVGNSLRQALAGIGPGPGESKPPAFRDQIEQAIRSTNSIVHQQGQQEGQKGMGATVAVVLVCDGQVEIGHVGDCRVYQFHDGNLTQVTHDQTLVARMVALGQLSEQEAKNHPKANEVTQAIGKHPDIQPAYYQAKLVPGDWLIVACDGLHAHVDLQMLGETLQAAPFSAALVAHYLVDLANFRGGTDNCTVVAVRCY